MIQGQVTTTNINQNKDTIGILIPNQKNRVKISQYADDSNLFLKNQESVKNVLKFLKTLNKAIGTTTNLEKTTVLPIKIDHTDKIQNITQKITINKQL